MANQDAALNTEPLALQRLTSELHEVEDRLRLTGELVSGEPIVLWLTRRLTARLVPHLLQWLQPPSENKGPDYHLEAVQSFAQQVAVSQLTQQAPVQAPVQVLQQPTSQWLIDSVEVARSAEVLALVFKCGPHKASLLLAAQDLRQWLAIVHELSRKADWALSVWPQWITEGAPSENRLVKATVH